MCTDVMTGAAAVAVGTGGGNPGGDLDLSDITGLLSEVPVPSFYQRQLLRFVWHVCITVFQMSFHIATVIPIAADVPSVILFVQVTFMHCCEP